MGDENQEIPQRQAGTKAGVWEHWCEHPGCTKWGGWGYASGKGASRWYCYEHRPDAADDPRNPIVT